MLASYTHKLDTGTTVNGDPVWITINGRDSLVEYRVGADYMKSDGHVYCVYGDARRKQADFLRHVCTIYRGNGWFLLDHDANMHEFRLEADALAFAQALADAQWQTEHTAVPHTAEWRDEATDSGYGTCETCGTRDTDLTFHVSDDDALWQCEACVSEHVTTTSATKHEETHDATSTHDTPDSGSDSDAHDGIPRANTLRHALAVASLALALTLGHVSAHEAPQPDVWPIIGTPAYDSGCVITQAWDDGSAVAYCAEDGAWMVFDPDGQKHLDDAGNIIQDAPPGWHVVK